MPPSSKNIVETFQLKLAEEKVDLKVKTIEGCRDHM
jgi:hypothetical protein